MREFNVGKDRQAKINWRYWLANLSTAFILSFPQVLVAQIFPVINKDLEADKSSLIPWQTIFNPEAITVHNDIFYFNAKNSFGQEIWRSDGTHSGTYMTKDINPGPGSTNCGQLFAIGDYVYIRACLPNNEKQLWRTDGTEGGTIMLKNFGSNRGFFDPIKHGNNAAFIVSSHLDNTGYELWTSDGTVVGTNKVKKIGGTYMELENPLTSLNGNLYFRGQDAEHGTELWKSDGTAGGTKMIMDLVPGPESSTPQFIFGANGRLFFYASGDPFSGPGGKVWTSDGTEAGTKIIKDLSQEELTMSWAGTAGQYYYFNIHSKEGGELWRTDGTKNGTIFLKSVSMESYYDDRDDFVFDNSNNRVYFRGYEKSSGVELWQTDGTPAGTFQMLDLVDGAGSSFPADIVPFGGSVYFATALYGKGYTLWKTNGSETGTYPIQGTDSTYAASFRRAGDKLLIYAVLHLNRPSEYNGEPLQLYYHEIGSVATCTYEKITIDAPDKKKYGDNPFSISASITSNLPITLEVEDETYADLEGSTITIHQAGVLNLLSKSEGNTTFCPAYGIKSILIEKAVLTVETKNETKVYGDPNPNFLMTLSGFVGDDGPDDLEELPFPYSAYNYAPVGTYPINFMGGGDENYDLKFIPGLLIVEKRKLTVTAEDTVKVYGSETPEFTLTYNGLIEIDTPDSLDFKPEGFTLANQLSPVGTYEISVGGGSARNYEFEFIPGTLTITKAPLSIVAENKTRTYGQDNPEFTLVYSGFIENDGPNDIQTKPNVSTTATKKSNAGEYPINLDGGIDENYEINHSPGTLTIQKATLTATADNKSRSYGQTNPELTISFSGLLGEDQISDIASKPNILTSATQNSDAGSYPITIEGGVDENYEFSLISGVLTIEKAILTATADNKTRVYGNVNPEFTISYEGFVLNDGPQQIATPPIASSIAIQNSDAGTYPIKIEGGFDENYRFNLVPGVLTIIKASQEIQLEQLPFYNFSEGSFLLSGGSTSGLPLIFTTTSDNILITGNEVTFLTPGITTILVDQPGNNNFEAAQTVTYTFCINPDKPTITYKVAESQLQSSSPVGNQWYFNNAPIESKSTQSIIAWESGEYSVIVNIKGCSSQHSDLLNIDLPGPNDRISYYPSPASDYLWINLESLDKSTLVQVLIANSLGQLIFDTYHSGGFLTRLDISSLKEGLYFLVIKYDKVDLKFKFLIVH